MPYPIKHLVVLMLENRSFDHMLGFLPGVNGLDPNWTNPLTLEGPLVQVSPDARTVGDLIPDPGHKWIHVNMQIFENSDGTGPPTMQGFVRDYARMSQDNNQAPNIMKCFNPDTLPILSTLAQQYAVFLIPLPSLDSITCSQQKAGQDEGQARSEVRLAGGQSFTAGGGFWKLHGKENLSSIGTANFSADLSDVKSIRSLAP